MKKFLLMIFFIISSIVFAKASYYEFTVVLPENDFNYTYTDPDSDFFFIAAKGIGDSNSEIENISLKSGPVSLGGGLEQYVYTMEIQGKVNSSDKVKIVLNYLYPRDPEATMPSPFYESDVLDAEQRFMVGDVAAGDGKVADRTYIDYDDVEDFLDDKGIPASKEYRLPAGDSVEVNAFPLYQYGETSNPLYDSFKNGNVITHVYDVTYTDPSTLAETVIHDTDRWYNNGTTADSGKDGLEEWVEDHIVYDSTEHDPGNDKYYRGYLTITKYVWFDPQDATDATPPNSQIEGLTIKARTSQSNRQRTSTVEIDSGSYDEVLTSDPSPFRITEIEERGKD